MDSVLRATAIYAVLLIAFRIAGKRSMAQITTFDFILLLVVGEATQQGLLGDDFSVVNASIVIATFVVLETGMAWAKGRWAVVDAALDSLPLILVENGRFLEDRARREGVDVSDVLTAGRELQGLERLDQIKYAVLERSGGISIVPRESEG
jgi:uncharacterized membrane protein YcaP (DUF421 family)